MTQRGVFLRRCHVCGATIESSSNKIGNCMHCGKAIAPFFYFDETQIIGFGDRNEIQFRLGESEFNYHPLIGVGLYWEDGHPI